jgi:hypothetical protein
VNDSNDNYTSTDDDDDYDVNTDDDYINYDEYGFQFGMAPRHTGFVVGNVDSARDALLDDVNIRLREYYLLPGHILKWSKLYPPHNDNNNVSSFVVPTSDSWIWDWFPDGNFWRSGMEQYGIENVVQILNQNYTFHVGVPSDQIHTVASAFSEPIMHDGPNTIESSEHSSIPLKNHYNPHEHASDESSSKQVVLQRIHPNITLSNESMKEYVVFYHISFRDSDNDEKKLN